MAKRDKHSESHHASDRRNDERCGSIPPCREEEEYRNGHCSKGLLAAFHFEFFHYGLGEVTRADSGTFGMSAGETFSLTLKSA